jgi:hypothetical protein
MPPQKRGGGRFGGGAVAAAEREPEPAVERDASGRRTVQP